MYEFVGSEGSFTVEWFVTDYTGVGQLFPMLRLMPTQGDILKESLVTLRTLVWTFTRVTATAVTRQRTHPRKSELPKANYSINT